MKHRNQNNGQSFENLITLIGLGVTFYIATINKKNLEINERSAAASEKVYQELRIINETKILEKIGAKGNELL